MRRSRGRLTRSEDFARAYRAGKSVANKYLVLYYFVRPDAGETQDGPRVGFSVSKRVGGAVERNRIKRVLREAFRLNAHLFGERMDFVLIARTPIVGLAASEGLEGVEAKMMEVFRKAALCRPRKGPERPA